MGGIRFYLVTPRRGLVITISFALAMAIGYAARWTQWLGVWAATQQAIDTSLVTGYPVAMGAAAWIGGSNRRGGLDRLRLSASRPRWRVSLREFLETYAWILLGLLINLVGAAATTAQFATAGRFSLVGLLAHIAFLSSAIALGLALGRVLPRALGAPVSAVVGYVVLAALVLIVEPIASALTPLDWRAATFMTINSGVLGAQMASWVLVSLAILLNSAAQKRIAYGMLLLAGVAAAVPLYRGMNDREFNPEPARIKCSDIEHDVRVCLPVVKHYLASDIGNPYAEAARLLRGYLPKTVTIVDDEASGISREGDRMISEVVAAEGDAARSVLMLSTFAGISAYTTVDRGEFLAQFAVLSFPSGRLDLRTDDGALPEAPPREVLMRWFLEELEVPIDGSSVVGGPIVDDSLFSFQEAAPHLRWLRALDEEARAEWFAEHREDIASGQLAWEDFG